jgi:hypothetical protein
MLKQKPLHRSSLAGQFGPLQYRMDYKDYYCDDRQGAASARSIALHAKLLIDAKKEVKD